MPEFRRKRDLYEHEPLLIAMAQVLSLLKEVQRANKGFHDSKTAERLTKHHTVCGCRALMVGKQGFARGKILRVCGELFQGVRGSCYPN